MNITQEAKALGMLTGVELKDLGRVQLNEARLPKGDCVCGFPNTGDEEIADEADFDRLGNFLGCDAEHARAVHLSHRSRFERAGTGSWGLCNNDIYPEHHSVKYYCRRDSFPRHYHRKATEAEILELSVEKSPWWGWSREEAMDRFNGKTVLDLCLMVGVEETFRLAGNAHIPTENESEAGIVILSRFIPGSTIGIGWFPGAGCRSQVEFHIDSSWDPHVQARMGLFGHECGHCNNLEHEFWRQQIHKAVMSYTSKYPYEGFSTGGDVYTLPRDPSWKVLERFYQPAPVPILNGDPPSPPIDPSQRPSEADYDRLQKSIIRQLEEFRKKHYGQEPPPIIWN